MKPINQLVEEAHANAVAKGFWDGENLADNNCVAAKLCLIHSEISEALDHLRDGKLGPFHHPDGKPDGFPVELADICIRVFDLAGAMGVDLDSAIAEKMIYNAGRPRKHGRQL
jgi:NTP pyrophosphatase (non-canonical NTP hydrolase)